MTDSNFIYLAQEGKFDELFSIFGSRTPTYYEINNALFWAARNGHYETVKLLLLNGAAISFAGSNDVIQRTIIDGGISSGDIETIKILIAYKANLKHSLTIAATHGHIDVVEYLISINVNINPTAALYHSMPLFIAAQSNDSDMVKFLLNHKANVNHDVGTKSVLAEMCRGGNTEIAKLLIDAKANIDPGYILTASVCNHPNIIRLLAGPMNLTQYTNSPTIYSALLDACERGRLPIVKALVDIGIQLHGILDRPETTKRLFRHPDIEEFLKNRIS